MNDDLIAALAERVMALTGPDREVDSLIFKATNPDRKWFEFHDGWCAECEDEAGAYEPAPHYTLSLNDAMTLVPEDYDWAVFRTNGGLTTHAWCGSREDVFAATPALALTAAALLARAEQETTGQ